MRCIFCHMLMREQQNMTHEGEDRQCTSNRGSLLLLQRFPCWALPVLVFSAPPVPMSFNCHKNCRLLAPTKFQTWAHVVTQKSVPNHITKNGVALLYQCPWLSELKLAKSTDRMLSCIRYATAYSMFRLYMLAQKKIGG